MKTLSRSLLYAALLALTAAAQAADYPNRPVRLVVPFPPGGTLDIVGRMLAQKMQETWGQPVVVENRGGAGSAIGVDSVAKSAPDGHALVLNAATPMVTVVRLQKVPYDLLRDLVGVAQTSTIDYVLAASPRLAVSSVADLVALARTQPGKLNFSSAGNGSGPHMYMELFKHAAGLQFTHVPYKGNAPAMQALLAGEVDLIFDTILGIIPHARSGRLRALMVSSAQPAPALPGVPTMDSLYPGSSIPGWHGIFTRAGTPREVLEQIAAGIRAAVLSPDVGGRLRELGFEPTGLGPEPFNEIVRRDAERWAQVIRANNIRAD